MPKNKKLLIDIDKINEDLKSTSELHFQNYSDFCKYLNIEPVKGQAKSALMERLHNYLDYDKIGRSELVIKKAFYPIMEYDKNKLRELIEYSLITYLFSYYNSHNNSSVFVASKHYLASIVGCITEQYTYYSKHTHELADLTNIPIETIETFFKRTDDTYKYYLDKALDKLSNFTFLNYEKRYYGSVCDKTDISLSLSSFKNDFGDSEDIFTVNNMNISNKRPLTHDERKIYLDLQRITFVEIMTNTISIDERNQILDDMKIDDFSFFKSLYIHHKLDDYYKILNQKTFDAFGLIYVSECYDIVFDYNLIKLALNNLFQDFQNNNQPSKIQSVLFDKYISNNLSENKNNVLLSLSDKLANNVVKSSNRKKDQVKNDNSLSVYKQKQLVKEQNQFVKDFKYMLNLLMYHYVKNKPDESQFIKNYKQELLNQKKLH